MCVQCVDVYVWSINGPSIQKTHIRIRTLCINAELMWSRAYNKNEIRHTHTLTAQVFLATYIVTGLVTTHFRFIGFGSGRPETSHAHYTPSSGRICIDKQDEVVRKQTENYNIYWSITVYDMGIEFLFLFPLWLDIGICDCTNVEHFGPHKHLTLRTLGSYIHESIFIFLEPLAVIWKKE